MTTTCPSCSASLNVKTEWEGKLARCPTCQAKLHICRDPSTEGEALFLELAERKAETPPPVEHQPHPTPPAPDAAEPVITSPPPAAEDDTPSRSETTAEANAPASPEEHSTERPKEAAPSQPFPRLRFWLRLKLPSYRARCHVVEELADLGGPLAVPMLADCLRDRNSTVRHKAVCALGKYGSEATPAIIVALREGNPDTRVAAARALGLSGDPGGLDALIGAIEDSDHNVRFDAVQSLGKIGDVRAVGPLVAMLDDPDANAPLDATIESLGGLGDARAVPPLVEMLNDSDSHIRRKAAESLGRLGDAGAVDSLIAAFEEGGAPEEVRAALVSISGPAVTSYLLDRLVGMGFDARMDRKEAVEMLDETALKWRDSEEARRPIPAAIAELENGDTSSKQNASHLLGCLESAEACEALLKAMDNPNDSVSSVAAEALEKIVTRHGLQAEGELLRCWKEEHQEREASEAREAKLALWDERNQFRDQLKVGMSMTEIEEVLGPCTSSISGAGAIGALGGAVVMTGGAGGALRKEYCVWDRPEGRYELTLEAGKLADVHVR